MLPPPSCWKAAPMLPITLRERTVIPRTMPRFRAVRAPSMENAVVTQRWSMGASCCCIVRDSFAAMWWGTRQAYPMPAGSENAEHPCRPHQRGDGPGVLDLAADGRVERGQERHLAHDHVALVRLRGAAHPPQAARQVQVLAAGDQRAAPRDAQPRPVRGHEPGLLAQLPLGAGQRVLAR